MNYKNQDLIFIVDDEEDILELIKINLEKAGYKTKTFEQTSKLIDEALKYCPSLFVLDLMLPDDDGFEICKRIRNNDSLRDTPIIMLTARSDVMDRILGLELGADDYVIKPFSPRELVARVKAVLRRKIMIAKTNIIKINDSLIIDLDKMSVTVKNKKIDLTGTEFKLLQLLASRESWVFSRDQLLNHLWGNEKIVIDRTIDVHINHLREKLGEAGKLIKNIRGIGYKLEI